MAPRANVSAALAFGPFVALLAWLSIGSTIAVFTALPSSNVVSSVEAQLPRPASEVRAAAADNIRAAGWFDGSRYRLHAARSLLALPASLSVREQASIEQLTRASLSAAPMSSYGWTLLSFLRFQRGDVAGATRAWEMSVLVGRYVPNLMQSRLLLGVKILRYDRGLADEVVDQVRVLAKGDPASLARTARNGGLEAPFRAILAGSEQSEPFELATRALVSTARSRLRQPLAKAKP